MHLGEDQASQNTSRADALTFPVDKKHFKLIESTIAGDKDDRIDVSFP